jgi:hypothetical protein
VVERFYAELNQGLANLAAAAFVNSLVAVLFGAVCPKVAEVTRLVMAYIRVTKRERTI